MVSHSVRTLPRRTGQPRFCRRPAGFLSPGSFRGFQRPFINRCFRFKADESRTSGGIDVIKLPKTLTGADVLAGESVPKSQKGEETGKG